MICFSSSLSADRKLTSDERKSWNILLHIAMQLYHNLSSQEIDYSEDSKDESVAFDLADFS